MPIEKCKCAGIAAVISVALIAVPALAQMDDGRSGPVTMTGDALNSALGSFNIYLQARYAQDDILAELDAAPAQDFVTTAVASATTPLSRAAPETGAFGPLVGDGSTLMAHLVAFEKERNQRGDDLFLRIARAETGKLPSMEIVAADVYAADVFGEVRNDPTLNAEMLSLSEGLAGFEDRAAQLRQAVPAVTGTSFEIYGNALMLLY